MKFQDDPFKPWVYRYPNENGEYVLPQHMLFSFRTFEEAVTFIVFTGKDDWEIYNLKTGERTPFAILLRD